MGKLLTPILVENLRSAVTAFFRTLNCRIQLTKQKKDNALEENTQRAKTLAVRLAFAVGAADDRLSDSEVALIKNWARNNIDSSDSSNRARRKLDRALNQAVDFFRDGNQINTYETCREIVEITSLVERYEILELCLHIVQANGIATVEELTLLKNLANRLEVDNDRFRNMMEKILPLGMHEVEDAEVVLGVTSDMSREQTRRHLNKEYRKWNSRVTNCDPEIQNQADQMLKLIADARSQYVV